MRLHILSDLHLEFGPFDFPEVEADLVILAGDIHTKLNGIRWIKETIEDTPVLYLCGNHEYYGEKYPRLLDKIREESEGTNVHLLEDDSFEMSGFRFFGSTLWTDMELMGDHHVGCVEAMRMNDYKRIRSTPTYRKLRPIDTRVAHQRTVRNIDGFLEEGDASKSIVITHHAPSILSLPERRRDEAISCAYASHLDSLIQEHCPLLWIHGHIHHSQNYNIGKTRIISNPRAYVDDPNLDFSSDLIVELEDLEKSYAEQDAGSQH